MTDQILVTAAVAQELAGFRADGNGRCRVLLTGMGERAGAAVRKRLQAERFGLVVSAGFAGGGRPGFRVGDLVAASEVIHASSSRRYRPDAGFLAGLEGLASAGPFLTVDRVLPTPEAKAKAAGPFGAIAVEMESAWVAEAAEAAGVPWAALRVILDPLEEEIRWTQWVRIWSAVRRASRSLSDGLNRLIKEEMTWNSTKQPV